MPHQKRPKPQLGILKKEKGQTQPHQGFAESDCEWHIGWVPHMKAMFSDIFGSFEKNPGLFCSAKQATKKFRFQNLERPRLKRAVYIYIYRIAAYFDHEFVWSSLAKNCAVIS